MDFRKSAHEATVRHADTPYINYSGPARPLQDLIHMLPAHTQGFPELLLGPVGMIIRVEEDRLLGPLRDPSTRRPRVQAELELLVQGPHEGILLGFIVWPCIEWPRRLGGEVEPDLLDAHPADAGDVGPRILPADLPRFRVAVGDLGFRHDDLVRLVQGPDFEPDVEQAPKLGIEVLGFRGREPEEVPEVSSALPDRRESLVRRGPPLPRVRSDRRPR